MDQILPLSKYQGAESELPFNKQFICHGLCYHFAFTFLLSPYSVLLRKANTITPNVQLKKVTNLSTVTQVVFGQVF